MSQELVQVYTRYEHGGDLVEVVGVGPGREYVYRGQTYQSARSLLMSIHGGKDLHMTFDRYFRQGRYQPDRDPGITIPEIFAFYAIPEDIHPKKEPLAEIVLAPRHKIYTGVRPDGLGIDLQERGGEVAKLFFAGFGSELSRQGFDLDDVLQEVYKGLMIRNQGECPFDPNKSSFGHYVHMVARCVVANYQRKEGTRRDREPVGVPVYREGGWSTADVSEAQIDDKAGLDLNEFHGMKETLESFEELISVQRVKPSVKDMSMKMVALLLSGHTQTEIQNLLQMNKTQLRQTLSFLRKVGLDWRDGLQL